MLDQMIVKRKLHTVFSNPTGVVRKYRRRFLCRFHGDLLPIYDEDYDLFWNHFSFKDKKVLDLGADYGSTASYFLRKGAKQVIALEGNHDLASKLRGNFADDVRVIPIEKMLNNAMDIASLISNYSPDIVKVDIEGAEYYLLECSDNALKKVNQWLIEAHSSELYKRISQKFLSLGFKVFRAWVEPFRVIVAVSLTFSG
jgi:predicted RNA methylase